MNGVYVTLKGSFSKHLVTVFKGASYAEVTMDGSNMLLSYIFTLKNLSAFGAFVTDVILFVLSHFGSFD